MTTSSMKNWDKSGSIAPSWPCQNGANSKETSKNTHLKRTKLVKTKRYLGHVGLYIHCSKAVLEWVGWTAVFNNQYPLSFMMRTAYSITCLSLASSIIKFPFSWKISYYICWIISIYIFAFNTIYSIWGLPTGVPLLGLQIKTFNAVISTKLFEVFVSSHSMGRAI